MTSSGATSSGCRWRSAAKGWTASDSGAAGAGAALARGAGGSVAGRASNVPGQSVEELSPGRGEVALGSFGLGSFRLGRVALRRSDLRDLVPRSIPGRSTLRRNPRIDRARSARLDARGPGGSRRCAALARGLRRRFFHRDVGKVAQAPTSRHLGRHAQPLEHDLVVGLFGGPVGCRRRGNSGRRLDDSGRGLHPGRRLHSARGLHARRGFHAGCGLQSARGLHSRRWLQSRRGLNEPRGLDEPGRGLGLVEHDDLRLLHGHRLPVHDDFALLFRLRLLFRLLWLLLLGDRLDTARRRGRPMNRALEALGTLVLLALVVRRAPIPVGAVEVEAHRAVGLDVAKLEEVHRGELE